MNTMPQIFDAEPISRAEPGRAAAPRAGLLDGHGRRTPTSHLKLVAAPKAEPRHPAPYDLSARRHLARVPERQPAHGEGAGPQGAAAGADNAVSASAGPRAVLEPIVFALVLLVSVAALAVGLRAG